MLMPVSNILQTLREHGVHAYGSDELAKFESQLGIFFTREYRRWQGNTSLPEDHGVSSFEGDVASHTDNYESVAHYNNEQEFYRAFLDPEYMAYTMAYYGATDEVPVIDESLDLVTAQHEKYRLIASRLQIEDGQTVLDIGCGFGGFMHYLLDKYPGVQVIGINPSKVQLEYIRQHMTEYMGDAGRLTLVERYVDELGDDSIAPESIDRVLSVGVLEHISNIDALFAIVEPLMKPGALCLHHIIVSRDTIPQFLNAEDTMMAEYFPGGHIWPYSEMMRHDRYLKPIDSWFVNGLNYWKTLDEWHRNFWASIDKLYPEVLTIEEVDYWNRYFSLCKAMFKPEQGRCYGNAHYLFGKG